MSKKKILYIAIVVICLSIISGSSLAYFTHKDVATNVITTGKVDVLVVERQGSGSDMQPYPDKPISIMPGTSVSKIVSVQSNGQPAWLRMKYDITVYDANEKELELSADELNEIIKIIKLDTADSKWEENGGWWYYASALKGGEVSEALFDKVEFAGPQMGNEYQDCTIKINVVAQAVQQVHNGDSVMEANWPQS